MFVCLLGFFLVCLWFLFWFFFPLCVFVAVTGIYEMGVAYTPFKYLFLKTKAVYLVKTPKL